MVTTGDTSLDAIKAVENYGGKVKLVIAVVDRLAGAAKVFESLNIPFYPLLTTFDLGVSR